MSIFAIVISAVAVLINMAACGSFCALNKPVHAVFYGILACLSMAILCAELVAA